MHLWASRRGCVNGGTRWICWVRLGLGKWFARCAKRGHRPGVGRGRDRLKSRYVPEVESNSTIAITTERLAFPARAQINPDNPQAQLAAEAKDQTPKLSDEDLARLYLVRKQFREAQDIFHKLTLENPKNAIYWNELGISFHNHSYLDSALKCYQKSAKVNPQYADAHNNMGTIYYERQKYAKAIRSYNKAIKLREDFATFYLNLGYAYFGEKKYEESIAAFRKALQLDPDTFEPTRSRSGTIVQDRSIGSDRARFYFLLAKSFAESGNLERCVIYLKKARDEGFQDIDSVKSDPSFAAVLRNPEVQELFIQKPAEAVAP
jgi:tetratricopeptide (TPR) repeat protein